MIIIVAIGLVIGIVIGNCYGNVAIIDTSQPFSTLYDRTPTPSQLELFCWLKSYAGAGTE